MPKLDIDTGKKKPPFWKVVFFIFIATLFLLGTIFGGIKCKKCGYKYYANLEDDREGVGYIRPCPNCKSDQ